VSIHQPLWRFAAALFTAPAEILANYVCIEGEEYEHLVPPTKHVPDNVWEPVSTIKKRNLRGLRTLMMEMPLRYAGFVLV
jgi:hypothetical protein